MTIVVCSVESIMLQNNEMPYDVLADLCWSLSSLNVDFHIIAKLLSSILHLIEINKLQIAVKIYGGLCKYADGINLFSKVNQYDILSKYINADKIDENINKLRTDSSIQLNKCVNNESYDIHTVIISVMMYLKQSILERIMVRRLIIMYLLILL